MKPIIALTRIACGIAIAGRFLPAMATDAGLDFSITPTKSKFVLGEPITLHAALCNRSSQNLTILFDYPHDTGLSFSCVTAERNPFLQDNLDRRLPVLSIMPDEAHRFVLVLDRYLSVTAPGKHVVIYSAEYQESIVGKNSSSRSFDFQGQFTVEIEEGDMKQADIDMAAAAVETQDAQHRREAIEYLVWIKNPGVIPSLQKSLKMEPRAGPDIVRAIGRFLPNANAREALTGILFDEKANAVEAFFALSKDTSIAISEKELNTALSSKDPRLRFAALQYLIAEGNGQCLSLVLPLRNDNNPIIARLAMEFVEKQVMGRIKKSRKTEEANSHGDAETSQSR